MDTNEMLSLILNEIKGLKEDVSEIKKDVNILKEDVGTLKEDVGTLKKDVIELKENQKRIENKVDKLENKVDKNFKETQDIMFKNTEIIGEEIQQLKTITAMNNYEVQVLKLKK